MRKAVITILSVLYLGLASGIVINLHYCMGQLSSVEYGYDAHKECEKCGMTEKDGCCNTESKLVKLQDSHQWAKPDLLLNKFAAVFSFSYKDLSFSTTSFGQSFKRRYHSPPDHRVNALYLHTSVFRI